MSSLTRDGYDVRLNLQRPKGKQMISRPSAIVRKFGIQCLNGVLFPVRIDQAKQAVRGTGLGRDAAES